MRKELESNFHAQLKTISMSRCESVCVCVFKFVCINAHAQNRCHCWLLLLLLLLLLCRPLARCLIELLQLKCFN